MNTNITCLVRVKIAKVIGKNNWSVGKELIFKRSYFCLLLETKLQHTHRKLHFHFLIAAKCFIKLKKANENSKNETPLSPNKIFLKRSFCNIHKLSHKSIAKPTQQKVSETKSQQPISASVG